ncbi:adenosylmethionine--8-amino-7-oxononanoate transaminase [Silanimonas sp.]|uniref:adenosylmethionine--8-amino-7-oxononanoate transaminase n=1 Tax=Silanimonas sp. TaxID=1929290 RepID=UPI001BBDF81E|nr:adenosylmethionine--8-amino-7-oxononanoate transaminase [Silanimonas sp.]MBS3924668.1 adenosylmethionine--8-amino-7-oxononanoate transaminase [Xanthomonadaceae bacterium]
MTQNTSIAPILAEADVEAFLARDLAVVWHPCTQMREHRGELPLVPIRRGRGAWLEGMDGRRYLDAISSWWTNLFGHAHPVIAEAIGRQAAELEHVIYAGFAHEPGLRLAERLVALAPRSTSSPPLSRVFYGENGSAAIEIALKMSFHAHLNRGEGQRTRFIALENGYHGETLGALAVSDIPLFRRVYAPLLMEPCFAPSPDAFKAEAGETAEACARRAAAALAGLLEREGERIAALVMEPRVQCAGGMRMHHPIYLAEARRLCDAHGVHLIADEIAVGFGRTGTLFACEQAGVTPDFLCLSKGLTAGSLPLSAVLTHERVFEAFWSEDRSRGFLHSHSYTGNPIACAAANATLDLFAARDVIADNRVLAAKLAVAAGRFAGHPQLGELRQAGMILAFELVEDRASRRAYTDHPRRRALAAYRAGLEAGAVLRPLGNVLYWMPPYCIGDEEIEVLERATAAALEAYVRCA